MFAITSKPLTIRFRRGAPTLTATIGGAAVDFVIDTGAAVSFLEEEVCKTIDYIKGDNRDVRLADGTLVSVNQIKVRIDMRGNQSLVTFHHAPGFANLWGRDLLTEFDLWGKLFEPAVSAVTVSERAEFEQEVFSSSAFKSGLGLYTGGDARIQVKSNCKPVFCKARTAPFSLREPLKVFFGLETTLANLVVLFES